MNDFYMGININQVWNITCFSKYKRVRRINPIPIESHKYFTLPYFSSCKFTIQTIFSNKLLHIIFYLVNFILENSNVPRGFNIRP